MAASLSGKIVRVETVILTNPYLAAQRNCVAKGFTPFTSAEGFEEIVVPEGHRAGGVESVYYNGYRQGLDSACDDVVITTWLPVGVPAVLASKRAPGKLFGKKWWMQGGATHSYRGVYFLKMLQLPCKYTFTIYPKTMENNQENIPPIIQPQSPKQLDKKLVMMIGLIIATVIIGYIAFKQSHLQRQVIFQDVIYGQSAEDLCGPQPPILCQANMRLGCHVVDKKWGCYPFFSENDVLMRVSLSADKKTIISDEKVLLGIDDDTIFNFFKTKSQLCDEYNITTTPDRKMFCENKITFKKETRFKSIVVSPDGKKVGFTIESDTLSPDTVVGIFYPYNTTNKVNFLSNYYLGNEFLSFSPSGANFVYSSGCWEAACAFI